MGDDKAESHRAKVIMGLVVDNSNDSFIKHCIIT